MVRMGNRLIAVEIEHMSWGGSRKIAELKKIYENEHFFDEVVIREVE